MKTLFAYCVITAFGLSLAQAASQEGNPEAAKIAREGSQAAKDQDWGKAIDKFQKASQMDRKYVQSLALAYQQRAFAMANDNRFQDALNDLNESIKIKPDPRAFEQRAAIEMRISDNDKALADYGEASKLNPGEIKYHNYRAYIYEARGDLQNAMTENDAALKINGKSKEAMERKARLQKIISQNSVPTGTPVAAPSSEPKRKKP